MPPTPAPCTRPCRAGPGCPRGRGRHSPPRCGGGMPGARRRRSGSPAAARAVSRACESVVVWSSMSRVTVVPAFVAAWQICAGVLERDLVAVAGQRLAQRGELERGLGGAVGGEPGVGERADQGEVGVPGVLGLAELGGVLAEVVDGRHPVSAGQPTGRAYGVLGARPGDEPVNDVAAHRRSLDGVTHLRRGGELQQAVAQQVTGLHGSNLAPVPGRPSGRLISGTRT